MAGEKMRTESHQGVYSSWKDFEDYWESMEKQYKDKLLVSRRLQRGSLVNSQSYSYACLGIVHRIYSSTCTLAQLGSAYGLGFLDIANMAHSSNLAFL